MRYREVEGVAELGPPIEDHLADATVFVTLLIGILFIAMGRFGRQRWLIHWGAISIIACVSYFFAVVTGAV
jgi:hypothetical protein